MHEMGLSICDQDFFNREIIDLDLTPEIYIFYQVDYRSTLLKFRF